MLPHANGEGEVMRSYKRCLVAVLWRGPTIDTCGATMAEGENDIF